jgi:stress response protein YsnF
MRSEGAPMETRSDGNTDELVIPVHEEQLHVGRRVVDTGRGVRVHKAVAEHPRQVDETLLHDELEVRHVTIGQLVPPGETPAARQVGDTLIVPVLEEVLVLEKRIRIREEIHITRHQRSARHAETVVLRSESVTVTPFDEGSGTGKT